ncbi:site-specific integrase [Arsukibacterium perlucidum]|uniref:site-specific integrase n=1 Tax=Arsukibacterium perlucidum TaxID=368811 RepID=UPI00037728FA|nr:site-specific integrase [Arsukibacterium perlucidum]
MRAQHTYLYRVKGSKSFYFRIRGTFLEKICHHPVGSEHFVASLRTEHMDEALWLSKFIKRKLIQELTMFAERTFTQKIRITTIQANAIADLARMFNPQEEELKLKLKAFLKESFSKWLVTGKTMFQLGAIEPAQLSSLRTVPDATIKECFESGSVTEKHPSIHSTTLKVFEHSAKTLGSELNPWREEALMSNRLIAELQKLHRQHENYEPGMISESPEFEFREGMEFLQLISTLRDFTAFFRRSERTATIKRDKHLQLAVCIDNFCTSKFAEVGLSAQSQYKKSFEVLQNVLGSTFLVSELDRQAAMSVKNHIIGLPSGRTVRGKAKTLSVKSVNKYLTNCFTLCEWLMDSMQLITANPFAGMQLSLKSEKHQLKRRKFKPTEIAAILDYKPSDSREASEFRQAAYWLPKIALYSGMRLNESAGLKVRDIKQIDDIWVFDLGEHQLKNERSRRLVPVHSKLVERGLLELIQTHRDNGELMLFPELQTDKKLIGRDGLGVPVSKWLNRTVFRKICIDKNYERDLGLLVDFHSARTTVISHFKHRGVNAYVVKALLGHVDDDITFGGYGADESVSLPVLKDVIELLDY